MPTTAHAQNLLTNGGFETGDFFGWNRFVQTGSAGNFQIASGTTTPSEGFDTPGAASGTFYAVTDSNAPGTDDPSAYSLIQSFTISAFADDAAPVDLSFALFVNDWNGAGALNTSGTLDYTQADPTQFARVDLLTAFADAFSTSGADVIRTFYLGNDGLTPAYPYTNYAFDLAADTAPGLTYQLRFASVQNQFSLSVGVDNVSLVAPVVVPEPATGVLLLPLLVAFVACRRVAIR